MVTIELVSCPATARPSDPTATPAPETALARTSASIWCTKQCVRAVISVVERRSRTSLLRYVQWCSLLGVPGPPRQRYLAGAKVEAVYPFAPVMLGTPLSIALVSYGPTFCVGIDADPAAIPDPSRIVRHLQEEIAAIEAAAVQPGKRAAAARLSARAG